MRELYFEGGHDTGEEWGHGSPQQSLPRRKMNGSIEWTVTMGWSKEFRIKIYFMPIFCDIGGHSLVL